MYSETRPERQKETRSKILWEITLLVLAVVIVTILSIVLVYNNFIDDLIKKSKNDLIETQVEAASAGFNSLTGILNNAMEEKFGSVDTAADFANGILTKTPSRASIEANAIVKGIADEGIVGDGCLFVAVPAYPPFFEEPVIIVTSEDKLMFDGVPESVYSVLENGKSYGLIENGIPEWGLEGTQLIIYNKLETIYSGGMTVYAVGIKPIQGDVDRIYETYDREKRKINFLVTIVSGCSAVLLFLITFFVLRFLIGSRITKPIDELSAAAEQVMEGDLDVEVPVREGEEFENLKKVFNEMLESLRRLFSRANGGE